MSKYIPPEVVETVYLFSDIVLIARSWGRSYKTSWLVQCQTCNDRIRVKRIQDKHWVAKCYKCGCEYTITPAEYYIMKPCDFSRIMGDL